GLDLVVVSTPTSTHKDIATRIIKKGINLIIEKPIAVNSRDAGKIISLARKKRILLSVYQNRRWDRDFLIVKKLLDDKIIGKPLVIESRAVSFGSLIGYAVKEFDTAWRYKKKYGGGVMLDFGPHLIDQILQLVKDKSVSVWCRMKSEVWSKEVEDYFKCILTFGNGIIVQLETSQISRYGLPRWHITGTNGAIICEDWWAGPVKVKYSDTKDSEGKEQVYEFGRVERDAFYKNILKALDKKEELLVKPEEVYRVMLVIDAARKSARTGKEIKVKL
ncbi:MAG: Gfo/Idh/MocA family oxidoreductase, partial [Candidatus Omnitrophica bacterium]|nr:Gfo/Idh/MocA family oxidoreductase [Candidatus Omnitrophota bacterium]